MRHNRAKSGRLWIVVVAVAGVAAALAYALTGSWNRTTESQFETVAVDRGTITAKVTATGTLSALVTVQVGSQVSGRLQQLFVDFNDPVKKGQVLAKLDPQLLDAAHAQARANFLAAQSNLTKARVQAQEADRQAQRSKSLVDRKLVALADFETVESNAAVAAAQVEAAQGALGQSRAALEQATVNLAYTTIVSPINGVVISRNVDVGQTVAASLAAPTLFVLAEDLAKMQVDTSVAEADVGKLVAGMKAFFTVDAYPTERFTGVVRQIRNAAQTVQNVVTYNAVVDVDNPELKLRPGMTANVTFVHAEKRDVLRVTNAALRFRPSADLLKRLQTPETQGRREPGNAERPQRDGNSSRPMLASAGAQTPSVPADESEPARSRTLWLLQNGSPESVEIQIGITDGTRTEIARGDVKEGDLAIIDVIGDGKSERTGMPPPGMGGPMPGGRGGGGGGMRRLGL